MDLEQKLEGPYAWWFAVIMCIVIVSVFSLAAKWFNHSPAPTPAAVSSGR